MLDLLAQVALFKALPESGLARLAEQARPRTFAPETDLVTQGDPSNCMYILLSGRVRVVRVHPLLTQPVLIAELGPGEPIGEMGLLDSAPRSATVTAIEETEALEIAAEAASQMILDYPEIAASLLKTFSRRIRSTNELAEELLRRRPPPRRRGRKRQPAE